MINNRLQWKKINFSLSVFFLFIISASLLLKGCYGGGTGGTDALLTLSDSNWMSRIDGNTLLSEVNIPGTHDSGTMHNDSPNDEAKCQDMMPIDQLNAGVRILDLRLHFHHAVESKNDAFLIKHGIAQCFTDSSHLHNLTLDNVLDDCINFLNANPTETVILIVKQNSDSHETTNFTKLMESSRYLDNSKYRNRIHLGDTIPQLGSVRGGIVWVRRYGVYDTHGHEISAVQGINLQNWDQQDSYFTYGTIDGITVKIQDNYNVRTRDWENKWHQITNTANDSKANRSYMVINLTSADGGPTSIQPEPKEMAAKINPNLTASFFSHGEHFGWVPMDFVTNTMAQNVYRSNPGY
jgi:1-phosphatidylinositol phosphodiesterase